MTSTCPDCSTLMDRMITPNGEVKFRCYCGRTDVGTPKDTLIAIISVGDDTTGNKFGVFTKNASFDPAGNKIKDVCPNCNLNYLTFILYPPQETIVYTCSCGYSANRTEHEHNKKKMFEKKQLLKKSSNQTSNKSTENISENVSEKK